MERIAFLVEQTGERLTCLLNPESMTVRRLAGLQPRRSVSGMITGAGLTDDPILYTGGGMTEIFLDLLFDTSLSGATITSEDVRDLTAPLWDLAENGPAEDSYQRPPIIRLVWGKIWNIPGIVASVAERLEHFTTGGAPRRSWMRMRFLRVNDNSAQIRPPLAPSSPSLLSPEDMETPHEQLQLHRLSGAGTEQQEVLSTSGERLDIIAHQHYGNSSYWRLLAAFNNISDPMDIVRGKVIQIAPLTSQGGTG